MDIAELKARVQTAESAAARAQADFEQASSKMDEAKDTLLSLGFAPEHPVEPQLKRLRKSVEKVLREAEEELNQIATEGGGDA